MSADDRSRLAGFVTDRFAPALSELESDFSLLGLPREQVLQFSRLVGAVTERRAHSQTAELIFATPDLDEAMSGYGLELEELEDKLGIIDWLGERVRRAREALQRALETGSTVGRAALRHAWRAFLQAIDALSGSLLELLLGASVLVAPLESMKEAKEFGEALLAAG
jgi:hypothetical protein